MGTVKIGRDIGLFASDAILNDLDSVRRWLARPDNPRPSNTALGRIGIGYIYADWIPQITYKSQHGWLHVLVVCNDAARRT